MDGWRSSQPVLGVLPMKILGARESVLKIVREIVHVNKTPEEIAADGEPMLIEWRGVRDANGSGVLNEDTARTKR